MTIDGINITHYGLTLLAGSYNTIFRYPKRKSVSFTNFAEKDGIIPDLRKIEFEPRQITLNFSINHNSYNVFKDRYVNFISHITAPGYRLFNFGDGLLYNLRYDRTTTFKTPFIFENSSGFGIFTINFIEDDFSVFNVESVPSYLSDKLRGRYIINGKDFTEYGIYPEGELGEVLKYPDVKEAFTDGKIFYTDTVKLKNKEITIPLWMIADSREDFINNYYAFFNQFNKTGSQTLYIKEISEQVDVYYLECSAFTVNFCEKIMAKLRIKLMIPIITWFNTINQIGCTLLYDPISNVLLGDENYFALAVCNEHIE